MACNNYLPRFQDQINSTDPRGAISCTCYSGAMAGDYHTCGSKVPTGKRVRELTGDTSGGTTLLQVDAALNRGWGINLDTRIGSSRMTWAQFEAAINAGKGAILQGSYSVIHGTKFQGDTLFRGNHAIFVPPLWGAMDPLCDGRRPGIYKYHGEAYPRELLKRFAGALVLNPRTGVKLGYGYVWCSLTRDNQEAFAVKVPPKKFYRYYVNSERKITKRVFDTTYTGFKATCTPPKTYAVSTSSPLYDVIKSKRLVELTSGGRKGWFITASWASEV